MKIKALQTYTKDRKWYVNLLWFLFCIFGVLFLPSIFALIFNDFINNSAICDLLGRISFGVILLLIYYKDLRKEFKIYKDNFRSNIGTSLKYYLLGIFLTFSFSLLLSTILKDVSQNENLVRELLLNHTFIILITITFVAPFVEELVYRKSLNTIIKNKWVFAIVSGILFGSAHIMTNIFTNTFVLTDLLYILPYGSYGFVFALMDDKTKTTFSSIFIHGMHNLLSGLIIINLHYLGVL